MRHGVAERIELQVRFLELTAGFGRLARPAHDFGFRGVDAVAGAGLQPDELGDILDPMDDVQQLALRSQHRAVDRAPEALLEMAALMLRAPDVVFLERHGIGHPVADDAIERCLEIAGAGGGGIVGIVGEHVEESAPDDLVAPRHRRAQVRVAHRDDDEVGRQHQIESGRGFEQQAVIDGGLRVARDGVHSGCPSSGSS